VANYKLAVTYVPQEHNTVPYVPQEHNMVTYVPQEHNLESRLMVQAYAYIHCDVMECVACLYIVVLLDVLVCIRVSMEKSLCIFLSDGCMI
jgi:hypothetical protein